MRSKHVLVSGAVALVLFAAAPAALAIPPSDTDPIPTCPRGYEMVDGECVRNSPPTSPPAWRDPVLVIDFAREGPTAGRCVSPGGPGPRSAADAAHGPHHDRRRARRDGGGRSVRPPPPDDYGPFHGFDAVVPASPRPYVVCVTAVNIGAGTDTRVCRDIDYITRFAGTRITYDTSGAEIAESDVETLDQVTHTNDTAVQQSTTVAGSEEVTETRRWRLPDLLEGERLGPGRHPRHQRRRHRGARPIRLRRLEDDDVVAHVLLGQPVLLPPRSRLSRRSPRRARS